MTSATVKIVDLSDDDIPPDNSGDVAPLRCEVEGCDNVVIKPSRGRTPKKCPEHRAAATTGSSSASKLGSWANAGMVHAALVNYINGAGYAIQLVNPVDGTIIANGADGVATALVNLGRMDKVWRKRLEAVSAPGKYGELALTLTMTIVIPIMANHNLLPQVVIPGLTDNGKEATE